MAPAVTPSAMKRLGKKETLKTGIVAAKVTFPFLRSVRSCQTRVFPSLLNALI
jgi:hypothetical protein